MGTAGRRSVWAVASIAVVGAGAGTAVWFHSDGDAATHRSERPLPPPVTTQGAQRLATELRSGDPLLVAQAVALPSGVALTAAAADQLSGYRAITIDAASFAVGPDRTASVDAAVTNAKGVRKPWRFYLVDVDGRWMISETSEGSR